MVVGSTDENNKPFIITAVTQDLADKGLNAGAITKQLAKILGGGGGGSAILAQGGGKDPSKLPEAIDKAKEIVKSMYDKIRK